MSAFKEDVYVVVEECMQFQLLSSRLNLNGELLWEEMLTCLKNATRISNSFEVVMLNDNFCRTIELVTSRRKVQDFWEMVHLVT